MGLAEALVLDVDHVGAVGLLPDAGVHGDGVVLVDAIRRPRLVGLLILIHC